ncbi:puromycin-sensitive aminopeptidase-like [Tachypleus tridentatus]|uniref:puromycin-sensitive aminopeptidase-like n=1 Tax=Tachypleus tridentatus TaxID=6853 RepID=UPI003FD0CD80
MPDSTSVSKPFERLPVNVLPAHYNISFRPDLQKLVFEGHETIKVKDVWYGLFQKIMEQNATNIEVSQDDERLMLTFGQPLIVGKGELYLEFSGVLNEKLKGFYCSKYTTLEGEVHYAAVTQFKPTDARRAFPCWDEPALKATFDISLISPKDLVTLSNMDDDGSDSYFLPPEFVMSHPGIPVGSVKLNMTLFDMIFQAFMSFIRWSRFLWSYANLRLAFQNYLDVWLLLAFSKLEFMQHIYLFPSEAASTKVSQFWSVVPHPLALAVNWFSQDWTENFLYACPISEGAMENWGLVTYRETCLLVDPQNTSADRKQWIALVVGHELAHQWFGNLVTMEWWTHLWLNEGFASFIEFLCVNHLFSEYEIWTQFVTDVYTRALELDALHNSHPIEVFSKGMNTYLTRHMYINAQTEDPWQALEDASQKPVAAIMSTWTKQKGFPVISVSCRQNGKRKILSLNKKKVLWDNLRLLVPINITTMKSPERIVKQVLLEASTMEVLVENVEPNEWVKEFFSKKPFCETERTVQQSLQTIRLNRDWLSRHAVAIKIYLTSRL